MTKSGNIGYSDFRDVIVARSKPAAGVTANLYSVPVNGLTHILGVMVCNTAGSTDHFTISISPQGAVTAAQDFLYFGTPIQANDTFLAEIDTTLRIADVVRVLSSNGNLVFTLFGVDE